MGKIIDSKLEYSIEPAFACANELIRQIAKAGTDIDNEWFFYDGSFISNNCIEAGGFNSSLNENFVVVVNGKIIAYFEAKWKKSLDIIIGFRLILFDKSKPVECWEAFYDYLDYLFVCRGCEVFNWTVAEKNTHAYELYEAFIKRNCGHRVGIRHHAQKSYSGKISDSILYEITKDEYFSWKDKKRNTKDR